MSLKIPKSDLEKKAKLFSVLGDSTRLGLVTSLVDGNKRSITELSDGLELTRQAVTKHLKILENAGLVRSEKSGRESLYELKIESLSEVRQAIESIEAQWDKTLARLKAQLEN